MPRRLAYSTTRSSSLPLRLPGKSIAVSDEERRIFEYLVDVVKASNLNSELRVAGGWVRDKLLAARGAAPASAPKQQEKVDLDIALNNMMGQEFARWISRYNKHHNLPTSKIGIVRINPAKSKHLETAVVSIFGHSVDLVNLRTESYRPGSRIPTAVGLGSPKQDSSRRDFTINALYYNIREDRIEDYTGHGLADLEAGLLRTPDEPLATLLDDPLRVLRGVRFKAMLAFRFVPELAEAMQRPEVHEALRAKVSRQRVGLELNKMLRLDTEKALDALEQIASLDLHDVIFPLPPYLPSSAGQDVDVVGSSPQGQPPQRRPLQDATGEEVIVGSWSPDLKQTALRCLREHFRLVNEAPKGTELVQALPSVSGGMPVGNGLALASAFLMPALLNNIGASDSSMAHATGAGDVDDVEPNGGRGEDELSYLENNRIKGHTEAVFKLGLALSSEQASCVAGVLIATKRLLPLIEKLAAEVESGSESLPRVLHNNRVELGNWMRSIEQTTGGHAWETAARLAFVARTHLLGLPPSPGIDDGNAFVQAMKDSGLVSLSGIPPLLSGREIMEILQVKPSTFVGEVKAKLISWQLANLDQSTKDAAVAYVKTLKPSSSSSSS